MVENTRIEWADHTLNWWTGCEPVSPACAGCYAELWAKRAGRVFSDRRLTTEHNRSMPFKWQGDYEWRRRHGRRPRVFVNSLSDFFDNKVPNDWREAFFHTAKLTPNVIYMLLTKRIGNAVKMLPDDWGESGYQNIWLGATMVTQEELQRDVLKLLRIPARVHFVSIEPMLGPMDLRTIVYGELPGISSTSLTFDALQGVWSGVAAPVDLRERRRALPEALPPIDWVIAGGESGPEARPSSLHWYRAIRDQCASAYTPFFFKQWGEWISASEESALVDGSRRLPRMYPFPNSTEVAVRLGKKKTGARLDGREHRHFP